MPFLHALALWLCFAGDSTQTDWAPVGASGGRCKGKERQWRSKNFSERSGEKRSRRRRDSRLCRARRAKRGVSVLLMPFCCFPVKKDHWWWKTRESPVDSAFAPVEKAGKLGNFFVEIFNIVENRHANAHKSALFASAFSTRKRGGWHAVEKTKSSKIGWCYAKK